MRSSDALVDRIHGLAAQAISERDQDDGPPFDGASADNTLQGSVLYPAAATDLKRMLPL